MTPLRQHPLFAQLMRDYDTDLERFKATAIELEAQGYSFSEIADAVALESGIPSAAQYQPDYGLFVEHVNPAHVYSFAGVLITELSRSSKAMWTTTLDYMVGDTEFAVSFDFHEEMLSRLFQATRPEKFMSYFMMFSDMEVGSSWEIEDPLSVDIEATVGAVVRMPKESFRPFIVRSVRTAR